MTQKQQAMTYEEALTVYFGGLNGLNKQAIPFTCKCGERNYSHKEGAQVINMPILSVSDCFAHIRKNHKERIKKIQAQKFEQITI